MPEQHSQQRWQPVVLIANHRLECACGALAVFVTGEIPDDPAAYNILERVEVWCQGCFMLAQEGKDARTE